MRPNSIIMLIAAIVFGFGAMLAARSYLESERAQFSAEASTAPATIVVARDPMRFGELIEASSLREIPWATDEIPAGVFRRIADVFPSDDPRYSLGAIAANEPILESKVTKPGQRATLSTTLTEGKRAVTIRVNDVLGVAGFVLPGDNVDIMLTRNRRGSDNEDESYVDVLLQSARVLAIDQVYDEQTNKPSVVKSVTFEVDTRQAQKLALGAQIGTLSLALRNVGADDAVEEKVERITVRDLEVGRVPAPGDTSRTTQVGVSRGLERTEYDVR